VGKTHKFGFEPYPAPGAAGQTAQPGMAVSPSTYTKKYPHVLPDC